MPSVSAISDGCVPEVVVEHEDRPLVGRQPPEPAFEQLPVGHAEQVVGRGRSVDRQHSKVRRPAALARRLGDADVDDEALEPRIEAVRIADAPEVTPGDHQRVLEGILGPIDVAQDPLGDREESVGPRADQVDVRLPIPVPCRLDEIAIHGSQLPCVARRGRLPNLLVGARVSSFILRFGILAGGSRNLAMRWEGSACISGSCSSTSSGFAIFIFAHGASAFATYQIRGMRDGRRLRLSGPVADGDADELPRA